MANKRIPELDALTGAATANDDSIVIFDASTNITKRILRSQLAIGMASDLAGSGLENDGTGKLRVIPGSVVTSVATGTGLTGGPITSTGTIALANTAVTAGAYRAANLTVDAQGRITAASHSTPTTTVVGNLATWNDTTGTLTADAGFAASDVMRLTQAQTVTGAKTFSGIGTYSAATRGTVSALTDAATITPDFAVANNFSLTIGGNRTLANPTNLAAGQSGAITITQNGTGGNTLAFGSYWKFTDGIAPSITTTANAVSVLAYYVESATRITATLVTDSK